MNKMKCVLIGEIIDKQKERENLNKILWKIERELLPTFNKKFLKDILQDLDIEIFHIKESLENAEEVKKIRK